jgi:YesN/AraC family two-component response regulator
MKHEVTTASSGSEALTMAQEEQFDMVITAERRPVASVLPVSAPA